MKRNTLNNHYTIETRTIIENMLNEGKSITQISKYLYRDRSNIAREINKHKSYVFPSCFNGVYPCLKYKECPMKSFECFKYCKNIEVSLCEKLTSSPHVCNGCNDKRYCRHVKVYYKALEANIEYLNDWSKKRIRLRYTELELKILNTDFKYLVLKNKSIFHSLVIINNRGFDFKKRSIYRQIKEGRLEIKSSDLPRARRKNYLKQNEEDKDYKNISKIKDHTYEDYINYKEKNPNAIEMQMDTVEGIKENDAPVILTLQIVKIRFLLMFKITAQNKEYVINKLNYLKNIIDEDIFNKVMEILLTDNGKEFRDIDLFTLNFKEINIFYCHPYTSYEKGNIENNHELIRRVIPKGVSLKPYSQQELNLLCSHINSLFREELDGKCPFDLVNDYIPIEKLNKLGLKKIKPEDVTLIPELLGDKNIDNIKKYLDEKEIKKANIKFIKEEKKKNE